MSALERATFSVAMAHAAERGDLARVRDLVRRRYDIAHVGADCAAVANAVLLDVRTREEFDASHIEGAVRIDPELSGEALRAAVERARQGRPAIAYCSVGVRSSQMIAKLERAGGAAGVSNLDGGLFAWANEGRALVGAAGPAARVHGNNGLWERLLLPEKRAAR